YKPTPPHPSLPSFPTRRSSDLIDHENGTDQVRPAVTASRVRAMTKSAIHKERILAAFHGSRLEHRSLRAGATLALGPRRKTQRECSNDQHHSRVSHAIPPRRV